MKTKYNFVIVMGVASQLAWADAQQEKCLLEHLAAADADTTVAQLRAACPGPAPTAAQSAPDSGTGQTEPATSPEHTEQALSIYRPNYVLPLTYAQQRPNSAPYSNDLNESDALAQKIETKFQISFKYPVLTEAFSSPGDVYIGYTQRSFWQMYNSRDSRPFRETDYEPEFWYQYPLALPLLGGTLKDVRIGIDHQSNGRGTTYSRSWSRIMGGLAYDNGAYSVELRPWARIHEEPNNDDNPDINHYIGNFDLTVGRDIGRHHLELMARNNLQGRDNHGAVQLGWSFPLGKSPRLRGYVQWFNGYGESLIDYNVRQNTIGAGFQILDR